MEEILKFYTHINQSFLDEKKLEPLAKKLMKDYCIKKQDSIYQIVEIEFYYYGPNHRDLITYPRTCDEKLCFFHQSGVDLTINSSKKGKDPSFEGILIKSIIKYDKEGKIEKTICGPLKCVEELFNILDATEKSNNLTPLIEEYKSDNIEVVQTQRYIPFNINAKDLKDEDGCDEKEKYQNAIIKKAKTKHKYILSNNKKLAKDNQDWLIASEDENNFEQFQRYLKAKYRFYLNGFEWEKGYKATNINSYKNILLERE